MDILLNLLNFNSKHHDKCKVELKCIPLVTTSNLFSLEVVQKCQLCVTRKNSHGSAQVEIPISAAFQSKQYNTFLHNKILNRWSQVKENEKPRHQIII